MRTVFIIPPVRVPVGGVNVILKFCNILRSSGFDAVIATGTRNYEYQYFDEAHVYYCHSLSKIFGTKYPSSLISFFASWRVSDLRLRDDDIIIVPEYIFPEASAQLPGFKKVLLVQDVFGVARAFLRGNKNADEIHDDYCAIIATSEASEQAVREFLNVQPLRINLSVGAPDSSVIASKKKVILYSLRKRAQEGSLIVNLLKKKPELSDWRFIEINKMSPSQLQRAYTESSIFLSFSYQEGFGLPPAEALLNRCLVVGYTGVGGNEFFDAPAAFPIPDGDIVKFVETVVRVACSADNDTDYLADMGERGRKFIEARYSDKKMKGDVLDIWRTKLST